MAEAYGQLVAEGWLVARQGSGTQVAERPAVPRPATGPADPSATHARYDLRPGAPDLSSFPRAAWLAAGRRALTAAPSRALGYSDPRGRPELRAALADYLARARGVHAGAERIVVCSGFTQGLGLLCRALAARGATTLATEAYGLSSHREVVRAGGLRPRSLPVDQHGAQVDGRPDAVLLTLAHQFPLGLVLAASRRSQVVRWAADTGGLVVEDDYDGEFRYDRQPVGALQALAPERVVYAGTASKTLAPGLRLGWLVLPAHLVDAVVAVKALADVHTGSLDQLTMAELITSGAYDRHVRRRRLAYRRRRDRLVAALAGEVPAARVTGIAAGLHALVELPAGRAEDEMVAAAARHGLAVEGLAGYAAAGRDRPPALVLGYATPPDHAFTGAVARLCAALRG